MIRLFVMPGACSLAAHILIRELGLAYELAILKRGASPELWAELERLNEMGAVPVLITQEGYALTEGVAILHYLLDQKPSTFFPKAGEARYRAFEWLNFIASTLHKGFSPLFYEKDAKLRAAALESLHEVIAVAEKRFARSGGPYALGKDFSAVDAYLYVVLGWSRSQKVDLSPYPALSEFLLTMASRPAVQAARRAEGLPN
jgi:glutathione S-transferase